MIPKTYCAYPFVSASLQADNTVLPCGQFMKSSLFKKVIPVKEVREGPAMQAMRHKMLTGELVDGCQCYAEEQAGMSSMRQAGINRYGFQTDLTLRKLELVFDNVCNIKCRSCASVNSHLWYEDELVLYGETLLGRKYSKNTLYTDLDLSKLEEIEVLGGEPTVSPGAADFFKMVREQGIAKQLRIQLSTNGVEQASGDLLDAMLTCRYLHLNVSVDAFGSFNEYVRGGADFNSIQKSLNFYNNLYNQRAEHSTVINVHTVVSVYNANQLDLLDNWVKEHFPNFRLTFQVAQFPVFLSIKNTPQSYKESVRKYITNQEILNYLDAPGEDYFAHFINFTEQLDSIRSENIHTHNSFLSSFINLYPNKVDLSESQQFFKQAIINLKS